MITIFASLVGFISSIVPEIIKLFKDQKDKRHQLEILDRQVDRKKQTSQAILEQMEMARITAEQKALYATYKSGVTWVDALNGTVRPVLAYFFFVIYSGVKFAQYKSVSLSATAPEHIDLIWNSDDQAIFAGIISFYFGQRTFSKIWKQK